MINEFFYKIPIQHDRIFLCLESGDKIDVYIGNISKKFDVIIVGFVAGTDWASAIAWDGTKYILTEKWEYIYKE